MVNDFENFEDLPDEFVEDGQQESKDLEALEIPDVHWAEDIAKIENPKMRLREIDAAKEIMEKEHAVNEKYKNGEMTDYQFWEATNFDLRQEKCKASNRSGLASEGLTYDMLGDVAEDWDFVVAGNQKLMDQKEELKSTIERLGPDAAKALADKQLAEGKLSDEAYQMISRQVRLHQK